MLRSLLLHHVERMAGRVAVVLQNPVLDLRAAIGKDDAEVRVLNDGFGLGGGCNGRRLRCGGVLVWRSGWACGGLRRLLLRLLRGRHRRLGLVEEELVAEKDSNEEAGKGHHGAHLACAAS